MTEVRELFLRTADIAAKLLAAPEVSANWTRDSALAEFSVHGLAGHLAFQVFTVPATLAGPPADLPVSPISEYYTRAAWIGSDIHDEFNTRIRQGAEKLAADGPEALAQAVVDAIAELRRTLPGEPERPIQRAGWPVALSVDGFLTTRILELIVHSDDLAHSVGVDTPEFPAPAVETVVDLLTRAALRRHGATKVLRALSRAERAPDSIAAL